MGRLRAPLAGILVTSLLAAALSVHAQPPRVYRIGIIQHGGSYLRAVDGMRDGLRELGLEDGKQLLFHTRDVKGDMKLVAEAARSLENEKVDLIYTLSTTTTVTAKRATTRVPIVFYAGNDPVRVGLVQSFARPGGRLTGTFGLATDLTAKRLELLKAMVPKLRRVVTFYNPDNDSAVQSLEVAQAAARQLRVEIVARRVASVEELRVAVRALRPGEFDGHFHVADSLMTSNADLIIEAARALKLPTIYQDEEDVARGALACYGLSYYAIGRISARQIQRVLTGANPAEMPVEQYDRLQFVINLSTARALGLVIPRAVLSRADRIIE